MISRQILAKIAVNFGKVFVDVGKLIIASFVLGVIISGGIDKTIILLFGAVIGGASIFIGVLLISFFER